MTDLDQQLEAAQREYQFARDRVARLSLRVIAYTVTGAYPEALYLQVDDSDQDAGALALGDYVSTGIAPGVGLVEIEGGVSDHLDGPLSNLADDTLHIWRDYIIPADPDRFPRHSAAGLLDLGKITADARTGRLS